jgi:hypothetical protein
MIDRPGMASSSVPYIRFILSSEPGSAFLRVVLRLTGVGLLQKIVHRIPVVRQR